MEYDPHIFEIFNKHQPIINSVANISLRGDIWYTKSFFIPENHVSKELYFLGMS